MCHTLILLSVVKKYVQNLKEKNKTSQVSVRKKSQDHATQNETVATCHKLPSRSLQVYIRP